MTTPENSELINRLRFEIIEYNRMTREIKEQLQQAIQRATMSSPNSMPDPAFLSLVANLTNIMSQATARIEAGPNGG
ncbi:hypothetical protein WS67_12115 [Burkholderia singularis]|uniref:Uncharacterized protein n=1 Tax=Burkholderia singularis TaxID=1503053 RepID=A0A103E380_9BURK|nr:MULTISPECIES: hypothetical protein [Burkholderia]KVE27241.1 hypothetical protein WS67_12115 [Burkholderia singularis]